MNMPKIIEFYLHVTSKIKVGFTLAGPPCIVHPGWLRGKNCYIRHIHTAQSQVPVELGVFCSLQCNNSDETPQFIKIKSYGLSFDFVTSLLSSATRPFDRAASVDYFRNRL